MSYVSIYVDIDLAEINTEDLIEEICLRLRKNKKPLSEKQKADLKESYVELGEALSMLPDETIEVQTLDDKIKYEHLTKIFNKYTTSQIESLLP